MKNNIIVKSVLLVIIFIICVIGTLVAFTPDQDVEGFIQGIFDFVE